jgi:hypothetical protein
MLNSSWRLFISGQRGRWRQVRVNLDNCRESSPRGPDPNERPGSGPPQVTYPGESRPFSLMNWRSKFSKSVVVIMPFSSPFSTTGRHPMARG